MFEDSIEDSNSMTDGSCSKFRICRDDSIQSGVVRTKVTVRHWVFLSVSSVKRKNGDREAEVYSSLATVSLGSASNS